MPALRLFIDTEFTSLVHPEGLSIGIASEDGRECCAETDLHSRLGRKLLKRCGTFVLDEVVSQFRRRPQSIAEPSAIGARLADWLIKLKVEELEVLYDFGTDYELFERWLKAAPAAHKLPRLVPVHLGYLLEQDDALQAQESSWSVSDVQDGLRRHHALADARALREAFRPVQEGAASFDAQGVAGWTGVDVDALDDAIFELDPSSVEELEDLCARLNLLAADELDDTLPVASDAPLVFLDLDDVVCLSEFHGGYDAVDAVKGRHTRCADGNLVGECHQGQQASCTTGRIQDCSPASCFITRRRQLRSGRRPYKTFPSVRSIRAGGAAGYTLDALHSISPRAPLRNGSLASDLRTCRKCQHPR